MRLVVLAVALVLVVAAAASASGSRVIRSDEWIGSYAVKKNGTLGGAIRAFGKPILTASADGFCDAWWAGLGLRIRFYNLGGEDPCSRATGFFGEAWITTRGWRTSKGLAMGDSLARLRELFPTAKRHAGRWWLVPRFTQATGSYAGLSAGIRGGTVADFHVIFEKGGE